MPQPIRIEPLERRHWDAVRDIYAGGIATGDATFETDPPDWPAWDRAHVQACRIVALDGDDVVGWAALSPVSERRVYRGVAEVSVYVRADRRGRGIGGRLLTELVHRSEAAGFWTLQAGIFPENRASVALHRNVGFRVVGARERLGRLDGTWRDVLLLERRSDRVGME